MVDGGHCSASSPRCFYRPNRSSRVCSNDGEETLVNVADLVPGDVIVVDAGADVPADARVRTAAAMVLDGSDPPLGASARHLL